MRIALLGDLAFIGKASKNNPGIYSYYEEVADYLKQFDYVIGNLETPFSQNKKTYGAKSAYISADPSDADILDWLHVKAVSLANNHMFDYGKEGYELTKTLLNKHHIGYFGTEGRDFRIEHNGNKIVFVGFCCYSTNPLCTVKYGKYGVNELNLKNAEAILIHENEKGYLPIFAIHSGIEHVNYPSIDTIQQGHLLANKGNYIYYGHHPHVVQGLECYSGSLLAYSLGNFCFDDIYQNSKDAPFVALTENNRKGIILELELQNNKVISHKITSIYIGLDKLYLLNDSNDYILNKYSKALEDFRSPSYSHLRAEGIRSYFGKRKSKRNLKWLFQHLSIRYMKLFLTNVSNKRKYNKNVKQYIEEYELQGFI